MNDLQEAMWRMYQENTNQGRHHEVQRSTIMSAILAMAGIIVGILSLDDAINILDLPLSLFLIAIGLFGALFSAKHYERSKLHHERARQYRTALDQLMPATLGLGPILAKKGAADAAHQKKYPGLSKIGLNRLHVAVNLGISLLGLVLVILAIVGVEVSQKTP